MPTGGLRRNSFSILFAGCAASFLMDMKTVFTRGKATQIGFEL